MGGRSKDGGPSSSLTHCGDERGDIATSFWAIRGPRPPRDPDTVQAIQGCHILQAVRRGGSERDDARPPPGLDPAPGLQPE